MTILIIVIIVLFLSIKIDEKKNKNKVESDFKKKARNKTKAAVETAGKMTIPGYTISRVVNSNNTANVISQVVEKVIKNL